MLFTFTTALSSWLEKCQNMINDYYAKHYTNLTPPVLYIETGKKYVKVVSKNSQALSGSAWCFINKENGDVLKAASWKAPAKHARGNIFDESNGMNAMTPYGPNYLK